LFGLPKADFAFEVVLLLMRDLDEKSAKEEK